MKYFQDYTIQFFLWVAGALGGLALYLIRTVVTNEQKIKLLEKEIKHRDQLAKKDNEKITEIHTEVREIRKWILDFKS